MPTIEFTKLLGLSLVEKTPANANTPAPTEAPKPTPRIPPSTPRPTPVRPQPPARTHRQLRPRRRS